VRALTPEHMHIARAVRMLREERSWTQDDLARQLDVTGYDISKLERGNFSLKLVTLERIAKPFGMRAWELLRFADRLQETVDSVYDDEPQLHRNNWRAA
jgi:transcriptional regulator with XRE-family HTH domain